MTCDANRRKIRKRHLRLKRKPCVIRDWSKHMIKSIRRREKRLKKMLDLRKNLRKFA